MVKGNTTLTRAELVEILQSSKSSKETNKAVKLLKKFDANPRYEFDDEATKKNLKAKKYDYLLGFMCWRCDKVKQTHIKAHFTTSQGIKTICHTCYNQLIERDEVADMRKANQKAGVIPTGFGLGLTGMANDIR